MGYKVKWVEENLGISRKALRNFEKIGLMPENEDSKYRNYSEDDINRIWAIRVLQGIGFKLKEIVCLLNSDAPDFDTSLNNKIKELEDEKARIENYLGYAQTIKMTGRMPTRPAIMGTMSFDEFHDKALNQWNVNSDQDFKKYKELVDMILYTPEEELTETDLGKRLSCLLDFHEQIANPDLILEKAIPLEILKRKENGVADAEVQLLVKMLYESTISSNPELASMTKEQFVRFASSSYMCGDISQIHIREYGKDGCLFIANAIAIFGGYSCYDEVVD